LRSERSERGGNQQNESCSAHAYFILLMLVHLNEVAR